MKDPVHPSIVFLTGLLTAELLFSGFVYLSNISLYRNLLLIRSAGYLIVPNELVMPGLKQVFAGNLRRIIFYPDHRRRINNDGVSDHRHLAPVLKSTLFTGIPF